jgi:hypothetical protein
VRDIETNPEGLIFKFSKKYRFPTDGKERRAGFKPKQLSAEEKLKRAERKAQQAELERIEANQSEIGTIESTAAVDNERGRGDSINLEESNSASSDRSTYIVVPQPPPYS